MTLTIPLPYPRPPLSANDRMHWAQKARITREVRETACVLAKHHKAPATDRLVVTLHYRPKDKRRRDTINLTLLQKVLVDGIVSAGVIKDDDHEHVSTPEPVIHPRSTTPAMWLELDYPNGEQ